MAKGKHSRALFEVIKQTQQMQQQERREAPTFANAPRATRGSWLAFLRRPSAETPALPAKPVLSRVVYHELPPADGTAESTDPATRDAGAVAAGEEPPVPVANVEAGDDAPQPVAPIERSLLCDSTDDASSVPVGAAPRQLHFTLSYASAGIAAATGVLLLTTAFLIGKHFARPAYLTNGPTLEQVRSSKAFPDVLNVGSASPKAGLTGAPNSVDEVETAPPAPQIAAPPEPASGTPATDARRVANRNYIIAQSYPDREVADKAADLLNRNNIPVSVEQLDYAPGWFCVVTRVGFDRVKTPEYERYEKLIRDVNAQAAQERLKKFDPYPYKWK